MKIFIIEDNKGDVELIKEALEIKNLKYDIKLASDGEEALEIIKLINAKKFTPNLIILDLNIPKGGGLNILKVLKTNDISKKLPVIILSSSTRIEDITEAYNLFANCYIVKPFDLDKLIETIGNMYTFWFNTAKLIDT